MRGWTFVNESDCAKAIWAKGPLTVQFNLTRPCPYFNQIMATTAASIVSKRFVEEHGGTVEGMRNPYLSDQHLRHRPLSTVPVSTGRVRGLGHDSMPIGARGRRSPTSTSPSS